MRQLFLYVLVNVAHVKANKIPSLDSVIPLKISTEIMKCFHLCDTCIPFRYVVLGSSPNSIQIEQ